LGASLKQENPLGQGGSCYQFVIKTGQSKLKQKPSDIQPEGFFVPENVVPKVRVELTQGHPYRFLSTVRFVLISFMKKRTQ